MPEVSTETQLALLVVQCNALQEALKKTDDAVKVLEDERNHALRWGIVTLGSAVVLMIGFIASFVAGNVNFKTP